MSIPLARNIPLSVITLLKLLVPLEREDTFFCKLSSDTSTIITPIVFFPLCSNIGKQYEVTVFFVSLSRYGLRIETLPVFMVFLNQSLFVLSKSSISVFFLSPPQ